MKQYANRGDVYVFRSPVSVTYLAECSEPNPFCARREFTTDVARDLWADEHDRAWATHPLVERWMEVRS